MAETQAQAGKAFDRFVGDFGAKYPKAVEKRVKDRVALLAFYDFPAEHGLHIRTTHPIESSFATIRHRTTRTQNGVSRNTLLGLVFQWALAAEKKWHRLGGFKKLLPDVVQGVHFEDGLRVVDQPAKEKEEQQIAA
jgi:transposase-like protein